MTDAVDVVDEVRRAVPEDCISRRCRKSGCSASMRNAPSPRILIDLDHPQAPADPSKTRCDYIFIGGSGAAWVAPMELKRGEVSASEVASQLQAGADIADRIVPADANVKFRAIAVSGSMSRAERRELDKPANQIRFRNVKFRVTPLRCRAPLANALR